jgi:type IX secretion system PorP/SprF family membrane protein
MLKSITYATSRVFLTLCLGVFSVVLQAQDPSFSQFYSVKSYLNPAMVGINSGVSINMAYRDQWFQIPGGYQTFYGAVELQEPVLNSAFGFSLFHDAEGQASLVTQRAAFFYNYFVTPNLTIGITPSVTRKYLDWGKFIFPDQLDPIFGVSQTSVAIPVLDRVYMFDMGVGAAYRGDLGGKYEGRYVLGAAANHLWPWRNESLLNDAAMTPTRISIHGGIELPIVRHYTGDTRARRLTWVPSFKYDYHSPFQILTMGAHIVYEESVYAGFFNQHRFFIDGKNTNALSFLLGYKFPVGRGQLIDLGINYDANGTGLSLRSGGVFEVTMNVNFEDAVLFSQGGFASRRGGGSWSGRGSGTRRQALKCKSFF